MLVFLLALSVILGVGGYKAVTHQEPEVVSAPPLRGEYCEIVVIAVVDQKDQIVAVKPDSEGLRCPKWKSPVQPTPSPAPSTGLPLTDRKSK